MEETVMKDNEILCIPGAGKNYAVEFTYIQEIAQYMQITSIPCLSHEFAGMTNYKGSIIPVIFLDEELRTKDKSMLLFLRYQRYLLGIVISSDAFIVTFDQRKKIEELSENISHGIWKEKEIYQVDGKLYALIDVEKTMENLVLYP